MSRKIAAAVITLGLVVSASAPAVAAKKKPKPYKSETVTIAVGHPAFSSASGSVVSITAQEFLARCAIPNSNGLDAYVFEVPKEYQSIDSAINAKGSTGNPAGYDLDLYIFDDKCQSTAIFNTDTVDESGIVPKGSTYILVDLYVGGPADVSFTLTPTV